MEKQYDYEGQQAYYLRSDICAYWNKNKTHKNTLVALTIQRIRSVNMNIQDLKSNHTQLTTRVSRVSIRVRENLEEKEQSVYQRCSCFDIIVLTLADDDF